MLRLVVSADAQTDLDAVWEHIADDSRAAANRLIDRIIARLELLCRVSKQGELRADLGDNIRQVIVGKYIVLYYEDIHDLVVLRVIHGARDVPRAFRERHQ